MEQSRKTEFMDFVKLQIPTYIISVFLAVVGVFFGLLPYYMVYRLLMDISESAETDTVVMYAVFILISFALQILMHSFSTAISHKTAFGILQ